MRRIFLCLLVVTGSLGAAYGEVITYSSGALKLLFNSIIWGK